MTAVLVSGATVYVERVAAALEEHGAEVTRVTELSELPSVCAAAGQGAFGSYVQLGVNLRVEGGTAIERVRHFYGSGVLGRFTALAAVLPAMAPGGRITFVLGALPWKDAALGMILPAAGDPDVAKLEATYDVGEARRALTRVLSHAARADAEGELVVRILEADAGSEQIAGTALGHVAATGEVDDRTAEMSYADWRVEMMGAALVQT
jgi:hypothetical protein